VPTRYERIEGIRPTRFQEITPTTKGERQEIWRGGGALPPEQAISLPAELEVKGVPLISFSYTCTQGVSPSTGTAKVSGRDVSLARIWLSGEDLSFELNCDNPLSSLTFKEMHLTHVLAEPANAEEKDQVFTLTFEDIRWRLKTGGIFGRFNWVTEFLGKKRADWKIDASTTREGKYVWTYELFIKEIIEQLRLRLIGRDFVHTEVIEPGEEAAIKIEFRKEQLKRIEDPFFNKEWDGKPPSEVLNDLLSEIDWSISVTPEGELDIFPMSGQWTPPLTTNLLVDSQDGRKGTVPPDAIYLLGSRKRDQALVRANLTKFIFLINGIRAKIPEDLSSWERMKLIKEGEIPGLHTELVGERGEIPGVFGVSKKDLGLVPVCPDISGKIRDFFELLDRWAVSWINASVVYQHSYGASIWQALFGSKPDDWKLVDDPKHPGIKKWIHKGEQWMGFEMKDAFMRKHASKHLFPEEEEYIKEWNREAKAKGFLGDFDVLKAKENIAEAFFFRLFQLPEEVEVFYEFTDDDQRACEDFMSEKGVAEFRKVKGWQTVPRSYVLPMLDQIDEELLGEEDLSPPLKPTEPGKAPRFLGKPVKQADKGHSAEEMEKWLPKIGGRKVTIGEKKGRGHHTPIKVWGYSFERDPSDPRGLWATTIPRKKTYDYADHWPELGIIYLKQAPQSLSSVLGLSEHCPFIKGGCPLFCEFVYERKDPRLGPANYYIRELAAPSSFPKIDRPEPVIEVERVDEFVELLDEGISKNKTRLDDIADKFAFEIWEKYCDMSVSEGRYSFAGLLSDHPCGPVHAVTWEPFTTLLEINTDFIKHRSTTLEKRLKEAVEDKKPKRRSWKDVQEFRLNVRGFARRFMEPGPEEYRRVIYNQAHKGAVGLYDPRESEDVSFCEAELFDPRTHLHRTDKLGPILCRQPPYAPFVLPGELPGILYGHLWWSPNEDRCGAGHTHAIGGFWYPWVRVPVKFWDPPVVVLNNSPSEDIVVPTTAYIPDTLQKGMVFKKTPPPGKKEGANAGIGTELRPEDPANESKLIVVFDYAYDNTLGSEAKEAVFAFRWGISEPGQSIKTLSEMTLTRVRLPIAADEKNVFRTYGLFQIPTSLIKSRGQVVMDFYRDTEHASDTFPGDLYVLGVSATFGCVDPVLSVE
jgi:hypothetical protein